MSKFFEKIKKIASENEKVAMFVDMDGTITVYNVYPEHDVAKNSLISSTVLPLKNSSKMSISLSHVPLFILYAEPLSRFVFQAEIVLTKSSSVSKSSVSAVPSPSISAE